jgi:hypothetical protein
VRSRIPSLRFQWDLQTNSRTVTPLNELRSPPRHLELNIHSHPTSLRTENVVKYKVVQIWPGRFVCKQVTVCPGHIWTTLYMAKIMLPYTECYKRGTEFCVDKGITDPDAAMHLRAVSALICTPCIKFYTRFHVLTAVTKKILICTPCITFYTRFQVLTAVTTKILICTPV